VASLRHANSQQLIMDGPNTTFSQNRSLVSPKHWKHAPHACIIRIQYSWHVVKQHGHHLRSQVPQETVTSTAHAPLAGSRWCLGHSIGTYMNNQVPETHVPAVARGQRCLGAHAGSPSRLHILPYATLLLQQHGPEAICSKTPTACRLGVCTAVQHMWCKSLEPSRINQATSTRPPLLW
jgi:hypothetical protein